MDSDVEGIYKFVSISGVLITVEGCSFCTSHRAVAWSRHPLYFIPIRV